MFRPIRLVLGLCVLFAGVESSAGGAEPSTPTPAPVAPSEAIPIRAVSVHLFNADVERGWYSSDDFWHAYCKLLAESRFNQLTLTFADQTNYLCPPFASLVDSPEYPDVRVAGLTAQGRRENLDRLRRIFAIARQHGLDGCLAIWMLAPIPRYSAPVEVSGLPEGTALADYSARGLRRVLAACPDVRSVQLRMNDEAGVPEEQQTEFYRPLFDAVADAGRPIRLELRYKGLRPATLDAALQRGLDVVVSTKVWAEHLGLPYHPTSVDSHWRDSRYSFGSMLRKPRPFRLGFQVWNVGSQRLTQWGDPRYTARLAESCRALGAEQVEVFAPLTNKGYGNRPGDWPVVADPRFRVGRWEQDRYWPFYFAWGWGLADPGGVEARWQEAWSQRVSNRADRWARAVTKASEVLPFITATRLPGASEWSWWPEFDTGGNLREYAVTQPSDPRQFYAIRRWEKTPGWRWEDWDTPAGYVDDLVAGQLSGRWTPWYIAAHLYFLSRDIHGMVPFEQPDDSAELRSLRVDLRMLAELARYHAAKTSAATHWSLAEVANQPERLPLALSYLKSATTAWRALSTYASPMYSDSLVFGIAPDSPRSRLGHHHTGHWRDRLAELEADEAWLGAQVAAAGKIDTKIRRFPSESIAPPGLSFEHEPLTSLPAGKPAPLTCRVRGVPASRVVLHVRPLDQTRDWQSLELEPGEERTFTGTIPAAWIDPHFDLQYYLEALYDQGGVIAPDFRKRAPYWIVRVEGSP